MLFANLVCREQLSRRLILTAFMLGVEKREYRLVLALLVSVFHLILLQAVRPYKDETTLWLAVCTSATMVYTLMDALVDAGLPEEAFFSDVLEYAPRS